MKKGDRVFYLAGDQIVQATVLVVHRNGRAKVRAQHFVYDDGLVGKHYLGMTFDQVPAYPNIAAAENAIAAMKFA